MTATSAPELRVVDDVAIAARRRVLALQPRPLALSGGRTPAALYGLLAGSDLPWASMSLWFGDERCVPPEHPDSNYGMAHHTLLSRAPVEAHRMRGEECDAEGYERELREAFGVDAPDVPRFDLVLLGLGADGHTASLFPGDAALEERERLVVRVERLDHARLTLTLPVLSAAAEALFLVTGAEKRGALRALIEGDPTIPAARVRAERVVVIADREAAP